MLRSIKLIVILSLWYEGSARFLWKIPAQNLLFPGHGTAGQFRDGVTACPTGESETVDNSTLSEYYSDDFTIGTMNRLLTAMMWQFCLFRLSICLFVCLFVCLSVTVVIHVKTAELIVNVCRSNDKVQWAIAWRLQDTRDYSYSFIPNFIVLNCSRCFLLKSWCRTAVQCLQRPELW